jgi:hypothetical protein
MAPNKLLILFSVNQFKVEGILITLSVISFLLKYAHINGADQALMITMMSLSMFYFLSAYTLSDATGYLIIMASKVIGIACSVCVVGITFSLLHLTGADQMLLIGLLSLSIAGLILFFGWISSRSEKFVPVLIRVAFIGTVSGLIMSDLLHS